jgi:hypothetical protein
MPVPNPRPSESRTPEVTFRHLESPIGHEVRSRRHKHDLIALQVGVDPQRKVTSPEIDFGLIRPHQTLPVLAGWLFLTGSHRVFSSLKIASERAECA